jgi:hypothetical protein
MFYRSSVPRLFAAAMLVIAGAGTVGATRLRAQEATAGPSAVEATAEPASAAFAGAVEATPTPAVSSDAGPRLAAPFESYQPSLPGSDRSESATAAAARGSHTIVLSTLALVLVVVIIVLLAVN